MFFQSKFEAWAATAGEHSPVPARLVLWDGREINLGHPGEPKVVLYVKQAATLRHLRRPTIDAIAQAYLNERSILTVVCPMWSRWRMGLRTVRVLQRPAPHTWFKPAYGGMAKVASPEFWFAMQLAMLAGFATSYPVNRWLRETTAEQQRVQRSAKRSRRSPYVSCRHYRGSMSK